MAQLLPTLGFGPGGSITNIVLLGFGGSPAPSGSGPVGPTVFVATAEVLDPGDRAAEATTIDPGEFASTAEGI